MINYKYICCTKQKNKMKTKHTQGTWEIRSNKIFLKDTYKSIAIVCVQNNFDIAKFKAIEDTEAIANAQLIAAAPELLEACNELISLLRYHGYYYSSEINKAETAIKKAIGE